MKPLTLSLVYSHARPKGYRRTVLVIWPQRFELDMTFDDDIESAIEDLTDVSAKPHKRERKLVEFLLNVAKARGSSGNNDIAQAICHVAYMWSDRALFLRAMEICGVNGVETLSIDDAVNAADAFGMETVQPVYVHVIVLVEIVSLTRFCSLEKMMLTEKLNAHRFQFLDDLETACARLDGPVEGQLINWLAVQRKWALEHLQTPRVDDKQEVLDIAYKHGGLPLLRDTYVSI